MKVNVLNVFDNNTKDDFVLEVKDVNELNGIFNDYYEDDFNGYEDDEIGIFVSLGAIMDYQYSMFEKDLPKLLVQECWRSEGNYGDVEVAKLEDGLEYLETQEIIDNKVVSTYTWEDDVEVSNEELEIINDNYDVYSEPKYFEAYIVENK